MGVKFNITPCQVELCHLGLVMLIVVPVPQVTPQNIIFIVFVCNTTDVSVIWSVTKLGTGLWEY